MLNVRPPASKGVDVLVARSRALPPVATPPQFHTSLALTIALALAIVAAAAAAAAATDANTIGGSGDANLRRNALKPADTDDGAAATVVRALELHDVTRVVPLDEQSIFRR